MRRAPLPRLGLTLFVSTTLAACDPYGCVVEARSIDTEAALLPLSGDTLQGPSGLATFGITEFRGADESRNEFWMVRASISADSIAAIHLHAGDLSEPGEVLISFPVNGDVQDVVSHTVPFNYTGPLSYDEFFRLLESEHAYFDIHTDSTLPPDLAGPLILKNATDWHDSCT